MWVEAKEGVTASPSLCYLRSSHVSVYSSAVRPNQVKAWHSLQREAERGDVTDTCVSP